MTPSFCLCRPLAAGSLFFVSLPVFLHKNRYKSTDIRKYDQDFQHMENAAGDGIHPCSILSVKYFYQAEPVRPLNIGAMGAYLSPVPACNKSVWRHRKAGI